MNPDYLGPAYINNMEQLSLTDGSAAALVPTLIGSIAQGIMLTEDTPASLSLQFNCQEESKSNEVEVKIPVRGHPPMTLIFDKECPSVPSMLDYQLTLQSLTASKVADGLQLDMSRKVDLFEKLG